MTPGTHCHYQHSRETQTVCAGIAAKVAAAVITERELVLRRFEQWANETSEGYAAAAVLCLVSLIREGK